MSCRIDTRSRRGALLALVLGCLGCACSKSEAPRPPAAQPELVRVAAASDLTSAFDQVADSFQKETGLRLAVTFGSSGLLAKQLREGAPFDLFASANTAFVEGLVTEGHCDGATQALYAVGHLVMWTKRGKLEPAKQLANLADARFKRIAIANPENAPYGKAAQQALQKQGLWDALSPRLVIGENIKQTMQFAESENAEVALVALSLALGAKGGTYREVDPSLHAPIEQALVVCKHGKNTEGGKQLAAFVNSARGRAIMRRFGLLLPGEQLDAKAP